MNFVRSTSKRSVAKSNDRPSINCSNNSTPRLQVSAAHRTFALTLLLSSLAEKLEQEARAQEEARVKEEARLQSLEENEAIADAEEAEKVANPDGDEEPKPPSPPVESVSSPATSLSPVPAPNDVPEEDLRGLGPEDEETQVEPVGPITADHPDVIRAVEQAVEEARNAAVSIPADVHAELMQQAIQMIEEEQRKKNPSGPL